MRQHNLFTSNSKYKISLKRHLNKPFYELIKTGLWFVFFLVLFDLSVNFLFPYPTNPRVSPGSLIQYFDYGRSIEAKVLRLVGKNEDTTSLLAFTGWINNEQWQNLPTYPAPEEDLLIATYGMSFTNRVSKEIAKLDPKIGLRLVAGPGVPLNHSFAAYTLDRDKHKADVVILGILASSIKGLGAMSNMTWSFEVPAPVTYPHYFLQQGELKSVEPKIKSLQQLRSAKNNPQEWEAFVSQLKKYDRFFNPFLFEHNWLDYSAIIRLLRRSYGQAHIAQIEKQLHTAEGFDPNSDEIQVTREIIKEFAVTAEQNQRLPIVLILNNRGYEDHLFKVLEPSLKANSVSYVSTHSIAPASDVRNFLSDGHFTEEVDRAIAKEVVKLINTSLERR